MASGNITVPTNYAGGQSPVDLMYIGRSPFGATDDRKTTLNDLFSEITKNITDGALRFGGFAAPSVSGAGKGAVYFSTADNTFKGSRNAGAYQDLLFGAGSNAQIAFWGATVDTLLGNAMWTFTVASKTVALGDSTNTPTMIVQNTSATIPSVVRTSLPATVELYSFAGGTGGNAQMVLGGGLTGPTYPTSGNQSATITMGSVTSSAVGAAINGVSLAAIATENQSAGAGGHGLRVQTVPNGSTTSTTRFLINQHGCVVVGANGQGVTSTYGGTSTNVVLGQLTTYNANAAIQCGNPFTGNDNITFLIQANAGQTQGVFRVEQSTGQTLFLIGQAGSMTIASTATPAVSPANQGRIYYDTATQTLQLSTNGGAYGAILTGGSGGSGANAQLSNLSSVSINAALIPQTTLDLGAAATAWRNLYLYGSGAFGSTSLRLTGTPTGNRVLTIPDATDTFAVLGLNQTFTGVLTLTPAARASGSAAYLTVTAPADTGLTASTEAIGVSFVGAARQHATGALTTQREYVFAAPTYSFVAASTITTAVTLAITGAPIAGTNATITTPLALQVTGHTQITPSGSATPSTLRVNQTDGTARVQFGAHTGSPTYAGFWAGNVTPSDTNYTFLGNGTSDTIFNVGTGGAISFRVNGDFAPNLLTGVLNRIGINVNAPAANLDLVGFPATIFTFQALSANAATVAVSNLIHITDQTAAVRAHTQFYTRSSGTAATGLGGRLLFGLESSTTNDQDAAAIDWAWTNATHASRTADIVFSNVMSAAALAETFRITANALPVWPNTVTAGGTTGNQTINKPSGTVNIAAAGTTVTVTNSLVTANSIVFAVIRTNDATARVTSVVPAAGSFAINIVACTAEVSIGFFVINK